MTYKTNAASAKPRQPRVASTPIRVLHVVETWRPVSSGYTARGWQIVSAEARSPDCTPFLLVSSRQALHEVDQGEAPPGLPESAVRVAPTSRYERWARRLRPYTIDESALAKAIAAACRDWAIDVIHCHWSSTIGAAARRAARMAGVPLVAEVRVDLAGAMMSETVRRPVPGLETLLRLRFERYLLGADAVVAASHSLADLIAASQPLLKAPVAVMPNAVDCARFRPGLDVAAKRRALGLADAFVVGSTTNMLRYEGLDVLLSAVEHLKPRLPELHVVLVGSGTQHEALAARARARGLPVTFTGRVPADEVPVYLNLFDLFVVPRRDCAVTRHASPIKLAEALACGVPGLGSALGDIPMMLETAGRLVSPDAPAVLADHIEAFAHDAALRRDMARAARAWALAQPDWPTLGQRYLDLYTRVLQGETV